MSDMIQKMYKSRHRGKTIDDAIDKIDSLSADLSDVHNQVSRIDTDVKNKQDKLTFDDMPTKGSNNPVKSGGVEKSISGITTDLNQKENKSEKGEPGGYVPLDDSGKIPKDYFGEKTISKDNLDGTLLNDDGSIVKERMVIEIPVEDSDGDNIQDSGGDNIKGHRYVEDFVLELNDKLKNKADTSTVNTELEKKQDVSNMVQDVNQEEVNPYTHYPSQMALKNALNQQLSFFSNQLTNKENVSNKANDLTNVDDEHYPTTKLLSDELDKKQSSIYKVSDLMSDSVPGDSPLYPAAHAVQDLVESTESISANSFSNALKGKKTGSVLRMDDVAPAVDSSMKGGYSEEHSPSISAHVYSKNLIPSGKGDSTTKTVNGITFKRQSDGSVVANGTATDRASYSLFNNTQAYTISAGNYFLSGCPKQTPTNCNIGILVGGTVYSDSGNGKLVSVPTDSTLKAIVLYVFAGTTVSNLVFRPQLELGSTATEYTDYVDVTGAVLKSQGKNLIPKGKGDSTTKTVNGITFKRQSDGSVVANGTATAVAKYYLVKDSDNYTIPKGNYFMSGCPSGSTGENYVLYCHGSAAGISMDSGNGRVVGFLTDTKLTDISIVINSGTTVSNLVFRPQLELGTEATEYEPYSYSRSYYVESDGSIAGGVNSISPTTTLTCDKANTVIVAEYNRDINKAFAELESKITAQTSTE